MKTVIITGGNSGLGFQTALNIARLDEWRVVLACRNTEKGEAAAAKIIEVTGNQNVESRHLDLTSFDSVRAFAQQVKGGDHLPVNALIANAGIGSFDSSVHAEGMNPIFVTNHLGHFLLTALLLGSMAEDGRVISVSSDMHLSPMGEIGWPGVDEISSTSSALMSNHLNSYCLSKLCNIYFIRQLASRLKEQGLGIIANNFNPGFMPETNLSPSTPEKVRAVHLKRPERWGSFVRSPQALAQLVTDEEFGVLSGFFYDRSVNVVRTSELSYNDSNAYELWNRSVELVELLPEETILKL